MQKIKGSLEFLFEKEPFSFQKCAEKTHTDSIAVPLSYPMPFFHYLFFLLLFLNIFYFLANDVFSNYLFKTAYLPRNGPDSIFFSHVL